MFCRFGFVRGQPAGGGRGLRERRVHAAVGGERGGQGTRYVECSFVSSRHSLDDRHDRVQVADLREHLLVGRVARLAACGRPAARAARTAPRRAAWASRSRTARPPARRPAARARPPLGHPRGDLGHAGRVDATPASLHRRQHGHERQLDVRQQRAQLALLEAARPAARAAAARRRRGGPAPRRRLRPPPATGSMALLGQQVVDRVLAAVRVDQVRGQLGVERRHDAGLAERAAERLELCATIGVPLRERARRRLASPRRQQRLRPPRATPRSPAPSPARPIGPSAASSAASAPASPRSRADRVLLALERGAGNGPSSSSRRAQQPAELEAAEQLPHRRAVGRVAPAPCRGRRPAGRSRSIVASCFERSASSRCSISVWRRFVARHRVHVRVDALERAEAHEQLGRGLVADARHARDVVARCRP